MTFPLRASVPRPAFPRPAVTPMPAPGLPPRASSGDAASADIDADILYSVIYAPEERMLIQRATSGESEHVFWLALTRLIELRREVLIVLRAHHHAAVGPALCPLLRIGTRLPTVLHAEQLEIAIRRGSLSEQLPCDVLAIFHVDDLEDAHVSALLEARPATTRVLAHTDFSARPFVAPPGGTHWCHQFSRVGEDYPF